MSTVSEQNCDGQLQAEIEVLKNALADKHSQLLAMENVCLQESDRQVELEDSIIAWQDKYERLYESHKRVQKVNQNLEDKLLKLVDRNSGERAQLTSDVATLSVRLAQANYNIQSLKREIERYKTDMSVAIQLLQCKPDSFVSPKLSSLPIEIQSKVATYMRLDTNSHSDSEGSTSGVGVATASSYHVLPASDSPPPMCPFPPTAMVYSMRGLDANQSSSQDGGGTGGGGGGGGGGGTGVGGSGGAVVGKHQSQQDSLSLANMNSADSLLGGTGRGIRGDSNALSPSMMAKFLEDELKSSDALLNSPAKHCETCVCTRSSASLTSGALILADLLGDGQKQYSVGTQTVIKGETNNSLCLRCNNNLNSPSHNNSPYIMKLIKSSDSVISETKSSVSDFLTTPDKTSPNNGSSGGQIPLQPTKKDDLMVNPILGHHRISDRTNGNYNSTSPNSEQPVPSSTTLLGLSKSNTMPIAGSGKQAPGGVSKKPLDVSKNKIQNSVANSLVGNKYSNDSPSYIIKDMDQMSGSLQTPKSGVDGSAGLEHIGGSNKITSSGRGSGMYHAVGSTNSLWSRTSSRDPERDGARIFENFNRNLIKTIKAENPKMSGPRICALRIQNGSSNILLDSLQDDDAADSTEHLLDTKLTAPVIYTRRAKFLDEELLLDDDPSIGLNGAIKTTSLPTASSNSVTNVGTIGESKAVTSTGNGTSGEGVGTEGKNYSEKMTGNDNTSKDICNMSTTTSPHSSDRLCTIGEEVNNLLLNTKISSNVIANKTRLDINVNKLDGIDITSKKSCTQSSSISSEIDIQESAMLRRQQLSRVAEWVQNNSKLSNPENLSNTESDSENLALASSTSLIIADSLNNNGPSKGMQIVDTKGVHNNDSKLVTAKISHSTNSINLAQPAPIDIIVSHSNSYNNNYILTGNNSNSNITTASINNTFAQANSINITEAASIRGRSLASFKPAAASAAYLDYNSNNQLLDSKLSLLDCSRQQQQQQHHEEALFEQNRDECQDDSSSVDLAQMEYNVKQFLLKQNEWSSITRRLSSSGVAGNTDQQQQPHAAPIVDEPLKKPNVTAIQARHQLTSTSNGVSKGNFPGTAVAQTAQFHLNKYTINPHRTETNL
ncbi:putative uncharacterized protein DDB_G0277255 [Sabethes cyaneus]|uniref:putative uncharacterized protein DDB_G0277255 n=1 Tax=Sabethes cyaneus TaxID=53552 RepID=UPI00237E2721|nr:putative uncharacterized protein DDB_G0277255 [Sabethes cyaneus]